jgi:DNA-binding response OmpR family regulator
MTSILVIEDDPLLRDQIVDLLTYAGYQVFQAQDGRGGIRMARANQPDLIICDVMMPHVDGFEVLSDLQSSPGTATTPFIFLTALTDRTDMRRGMNLGADDYLPKPFRPNDLLNAVKTQLLKRQRLTEEYEARMAALRTNITTALPHEIRSSIESIVSSTNNLLAMSGTQTMLSAERVNSVLRIVQRSAHRLEHVAENYLLYARLESVATDEQRIAELRAEYTGDPATALYNTAWEKARQYQRQRDLETAFNDAPVAISASSLEKIAFELVDNALKFSEPGTRIIVAAEAGDDGCYHILIRDYGRGMTAEHLSSIGAYVRFENTLYERVGTGLGLSIVKRMVAVYGGTFEIDSAPGEGTEARIRLPLA